MLISQLNSTRIIIIIIIINNNIFLTCTVSPDVRDAYFGSLDKAFVGFTFIDDSAPLNKMMMSGSVR